MGKRVKKAWRFGIEPKPHALACHVLDGRDCTCGSLSDYRQRLNAAIEAHDEAAVALLKDSAP